MEFHSWKVKWPESLIKCGGRCFRRNSWAVSCVCWGSGTWKRGSVNSVGRHGGKRNISWIRQRKNRRKISSDPVAQARVWPPLFMHRLPGVMFSLEEVHKNFSVSVLVSVMSASLTADFLSSTILGMDSVFQFDILKALPMEYYWMILLLGVVLGITGAFYNWFTLKAQECYQKATFLNPTMKIVVPFLCAGLIGFTAPQLLGSGHALIEELTHTEMMLGTILLLLLGTIFIFGNQLWLRSPGRYFLPIVGDRRIYRRSIRGSRCTVFWLR